MLTSGKVAGSLGSLGSTLPIAAEARRLIDSPESRESPREPVTFPDGGLFLGLSTKVRRCFLDEKTMHFYFRILHGAAFGCAIYSASRLWAPTPLLIFLTSVSFCQSRLFDLRTFTLTLSTSTCLHLLIPTLNCCAAMDVARRSSIPLHIHVTTPSR